MMKPFLFAAAAAAMTICTPAVAQDAPPLVGGEYWQVTGVDVADGAAPRYSNWLATEWMRFNDFATEQGWISGYKILANVHNRHDEPDLYLITMFNNLADADEQERRRVAFEQFARRSNDQLAAESGNRAQYRTVMSTSLLQELHKRGQ